METLRTYIYKQEGYQALTESEKVSFVKNKLIKYLPSFVNHNSEVLHILLNSIALAMVRVYDSIYKLQDANWEGKGLRLSADEYRLFYKATDNDEAIRNKLEQRYTILTKRGTEQGIANDLAGLDCEYAPEIAFVDESGWVIDATYPETDKDVYLDGERAIIINVSYAGTFGRAVFRETKLGINYLQFIQDFVAHIRKYIVPAHITIIYK